MNYQKAISENYKHMGTAPSEWVAVPVIGMAEVDTGNGKSQSMPQFDFPKGYSAAPSLYTGECCHLCGTPIKNVYWIQNDKRRWTMPVGSECVTHFGEGESGQTIAKKAVWKKNRELLNHLLSVYTVLDAAYNDAFHPGYKKGSYHEKSSAYKIMHSVKKCLGKTINKNSKDGAITRWVSNRGEQAQQLIDNAHDLIWDDVALSGIITDLWRELGLPCKYPKPECNSDTANTIQHDTGCQ